MPVAPLRGRRNYAASTVKRADNFAMPVVRVTVVSMTTGPDQAHAAGSPGLRDSEEGPQPLPAQPGELRHQPRPWT